MNKREIDDLIGDDSQKAITYFRQMKALKAVNELRGLKNKLSKANFITITLSKFEFVNEGWFKVEELQPEPTRSSWDNVSKKINFDLGQFLFISEREIEYIPHRSIRELKIFKGEDKFFHSFNNTSEGITLEPGEYLFWADTQELFLKLKL